LTWHGAPAGNQPAWWGRMAGLRAGSSDQTVRRTLHGSPPFFLKDADDRYRTTPFILIRTLSVVNQIPAVAINFFGGIRHPQIGS